MPPKGKGKGKGGPPGTGGAGEEAKGGEKISEVRREMAAVVLTYNSHSLCTSCNEYRIQGVFDLPLDLHMAKNKALLKLLLLLITKLSNSPG